METGFNKKKRYVRFFVIIGIIVACVTILWGIHHFKQDKISVVKVKHENGMDKEVWVYKRSFFGKEKIKMITNFSDGNKESEVDYKKGKVNGWARMWYNNGKLHVEATYKNSKVHGVRSSYHENGQIFCRAKYKMGKIISKRNWDEEGNEIYLPIDRE